MLTTDCPSSTIKNVPRTTGRFFTFTILIACLALTSVLQAQTVVSVTATQPIAGATPGVFTINRAGDSSQPLTIPFNLSGTAVMNADYTVDSQASGTLNPSSVVGKVGRAFSFDGQSQYIQGADDPKLDPVDEGSIDAWVYFNHLPSTSSSPIMVIADKSGFADDFLLAAERDTNKFVFSIGTRLIVESTTVIQTGRWYHVAATYKAQTETKIYVNGVLENTRTIDQRRARSVSVPFAIGRTIGLAFLNGPSFFNGLIDELHVFNRVLSAAEISAIYTADTAGLCQPSGPTPNCIQPPAGLTGWFTGDSDARNIVENIFSPGTVAQAFTFNGVSQSVQYPHVASQDPTTEATLDAWVYFNQLPSEVNHFITIMAKSGLNRDLDLLAFSDDKIRFYVGVGSFVSSNTVMQKGRWYHIAATFKADADMRLYINGVLENTQPLSGGRGANGNPLTIGESAVARGRYFGGLIDEAQMYNRALSAAEIQSIYNAGGAGLCKPSGQTPACVQPPAGLVGWWPGDGDTRDLVTRLSGTLIGYDYTFFGKQLTFAADQTSLTINVRPLFSMNSAGHTVVLTLLPDPLSNFGVDAVKGSATVVLNGRSPTTELSLTSIAPNKGGTASSVTSIIYGQGFKPGVTVKLVRAGQPDIVASQTAAAPDESSVAATFDLTGKAEGIYDVVVANTGGTVKTLAGAFTIEQKKQLSLFVNVIAREAIRIGHEYNFYVTYGNSGNVDVTNAPLWVAVPNFVSITPETDLLFTAVPIGNKTYIKIILPRVRAGSDAAPDTLVVKIKVADPNNTHRLFSTKAVLLNPQFDPRGSSSSSASGMSARESSVMRSGGESRAYAEPTVEECANAAPEEFLDDIINNGGDNYVKCLDKLNPSVDDYGPFALPEAEAKANEAIRKASGAIGRSGGTDPRTSNDPNEKSRAGGVGTLGYVTGSASLPYAIYFENKDTADLPALDVTVTDQLDPAKVDLDTFSFGIISFGKYRFTPPAGQKSFVGYVDLRPDKNLLVKITGSINTTTGLVNWTFNTLDSATGNAPQDTLAGFLPPNKTSPEGQGAVTFNVIPKSGLPTNAAITNTARIVFDVNAAIDTATVTNTIDKSAPASQLQPAAANVPYSFVVNWGGTDQGSGVSYYTVYVSDNGGAYNKFLSTSESSAVFTGQAGHTYGFYSIAFDRVGLSEANKTASETIATVNNSNGNAIDDATFFVSQHYRDFLNRTPDVGGFNFWVNEITSCNANALCVDRKRVNTSGAYFISTEFQSTGYFVYRLYKGALNRQPSFAEFKLDQPQVASAIVVNNQLSDSAIENNKNAFATQFVNRADFKAIYDSLDNAGYVNKLADNTGVVSNADRQALISGLNAATETRVSVLRKILDGTTTTGNGKLQFTTTYGKAFYDKAYNPAFVLMQYFGYLRRDPDADGYAFWLKKLNDYKNFIDAEMVRSFIVSDEYRKRFDAQ